MSTRPLTIETVVQDPSIRGGRPTIAGTGLRVSDIAAYHIYEGLSPEQLAIQFRLDLAQVHAALSFYFAHRAEIDDEIRANAEESERWRRRLN